MGAAIGQSLPIAVGVLISPLPIVAVVLMLVSGRAKANAFAFIIGWFLAVGVVALLVAFLAGSGKSADGQTPLWAAIVKIILGVALVALAAKQWSDRPHGDRKPSTPGWMTAIDKFTPMKAAGLAVLLGVINPKNLLLVISGGAAIATAATGNASAQIVASVVFALVASVGVAVPFFIYLFLGDRATTLLDELKAWMIHHNAVIVAVLLLILGAKMLGDGIAAL